MTGVLLRVTLLLLVLLLAGCRMELPEQWTVKPAPDGKWRVCLREGVLDVVLAGSQSCGSPMSYDEAKWLSETRGGREVPRWETTP